MNENPSEALRPKQEPDESSQPNRVSEGGLTAAYDAYNKDLSGYESTRAKLFEELRAQGERVNRAGMAAAQPTPAVTEAREAIAGEAGRQAREKPGMPGEPVAPKRPETIRPFGTGSGPMNSLQASMNAIGLIIAMGVGTSKGYARGALAAYSGALDGWAQGDQKRAEREWKTYLDQVEQGNANYKRAMERREAMLRDNKDTLDQLKIRMAIAEAEQGSKKEIVQLMSKDLEQGMKMFELEGKQWNELRKLSWDQFKFMVNDSEKKRMDDSLVQHRQNIENQMTQRLNQTKAVHKDVMDKLAVQMDQFTFNKIALPYERQVLSLGNMQKMKQAIAVLDRKGLLPSGPTPIEDWEAWAGRKMAVGDVEAAKAIQLIHSLYGPTIIGGIDRTTFNELLRAYGAFQPQLKLIENLAPRAAMDAIFDRWENVLKQGMRMNEEAAVAYQGSPKPAALMRSMRAAEGLINQDPRIDSLDAELEGAK